MELPQFDGHSRAGYYAWIDRKPSKRAQENETLSQQIIEIHHQSRGTYGSPRVTEELEARGFKADRMRVARRMAEMGISGDLKPKFRKADAEPTAELAPNLLNRQFDVDAPDRVWVSLRHLRDAPARLLRLRWIGALDEGLALDVELVPLPG